MSFLRRLLGGGRPSTASDADSSLAERITPTPAKAAEERSGVATLAQPAAPARAKPAPEGAPCPYCGMLLRPIPERPRLCPRCRRPIVVRRIEGRRVLLTKDAVEVFDSERQRETNERLWTGERERWLILAKGVSAAPARISKLGAATPTAAVVQSSRELYLATAERAIKAARRDKKWQAVARIRRQQAAALYRESGSAVPPPEDILALHRMWSEAALRSLVKFGEQAELVSTGCCQICDRDSGKAFRIRDELRGERLPHAGCPKGLCACDWFPLPGKAVKAKRKRRTARPRPAGNGSGDSDTSSPDMATSDGTSADELELDAGKPDGPVVDAPEEDEA